MNNGEEDKLALIVEKQDAFKFESDMFTKEFIEDLEFDLANLKRVKRMWEPVKYDPKLEKFLDDLKTNKLLKTTSKLS